MAILKEIRKSKQVSYIERPNPQTIIIMIFSDGIGENLFPFKTTLELQFPELSTVEEANKYIGREFEVNLHTYSVSELTNGKHDCFRLFDDVKMDLGPKITEYRIASYKSKEDCKFQLLKQLLVLSFNGNIYYLDSRGRPKVIEDTISTFNIGFLLPYRMTIAQKRVEMDILGRRDDPEGSAAKMALIKYNAKLGKKYKEKKLRML